MPKVAVMLDIESAYYTCIIACRFDVFVCVHPSVSISHAAPKDAIRHSGCSLSLL